MSISFRRFLSLCVIIISLSLGLGRTGPTPVTWAAPPLETPLQNSRLYSPADTPPGLTAGEWAQITRQLDGAPLAAAPTQQAYLKASNTAGGDRFGYAVAISGETVVVGAPNEDSNAARINGDQADDSAGDAGAAYVFGRSSGSWSQKPI